MLRLPPPPKPREQETTFDTVCRLARELDVAGLNEMKVRNDLFLYTQQNGYLPIHALAMEDNVAAVTLLVNEFGAYPGYALRGFAEAGLIHRVNEILKTDTFGGSARLYFNSVAPGIAAEGYARGGLHHLVDEILRKNPGFRNDVIDVYTDLKNWDRVEVLVTAGGELNVDCIPVAAVTSKELCLRLMSIVNGEDARRKIMALYDPWKADDEVEYFQPLKQAARINRIMREYHLNYRQASALQQFQENGHLQGVREWLLKGIQLTDDRSENNMMKDGNDYRLLPLLPKDLIVKITSLLLGLSVDDTLQILIGVQAQLFVSVAKSKAEQFAFGLFTTTKYMSEQIKPIDAYESKVKRFKPDI